MCGGCGSVGRAVASDTIGLQVESSHRQILFAIKCIEKNENKQKEAVIGPLFLKKRIKFKTRGTAIAQRIRVSLPFCRPESGLSMLSSIIVNFFRTKKRPGLANYKSLSHGSVDPSAAVILWPLV